jgi:hypothetical protein
VIRRNPRTCRDKEAGRPRIGLPYLTADATEENEPGGDDQHREVEETDGASIRVHFSFTAMRIGR